MKYMQDSKNSKFLIDKSNLVLNKINIFRKFNKEYKKKMLILILCLIDINKMDKITYIQGIYIVHSNLILYQLYIIGTIIYNKKGMTI